MATAWSLLCGPPGVSGLPQQGPSSASSQALTEGCVHHTQPVTAPRGLGFRDLPAPHHCSSGPCHTRVGCGGEGRTTDGNSGGFWVFQTLPLRHPGSPIKHLHRDILQALRVRALRETTAEHACAKNVKVYVPICSKNLFCPVSLGHPSGSEQESCP